MHGGAGKLDFTALLDFHALETNLQFLHRGTSRRDGGQKILRAIDIQTGDVKWELPQTGPANSWGGVLATRGGIVLFCEDGGLFSAADARTGKRLWQWPAELVWRSSPMTYAFDGKQYVAIAAGSNIVSFGLTQ